MVEKKKTRRQLEAIARSHIDRLQANLRKIRQQRVLMTLDTDDSSDAQNDQYSEAVDNLTKVTNYVAGNEPPPEQSDAKLGAQKPGKTTMRDKSNA